MRDRKQEITYHRANLKKQSSYVRIYDFLSRSEEFFFPKKNLGSGSFGEVRLCTSEEGNQVVVKSHIEKTQVFKTKKERNEATLAIEREFVLLKQASEHQVKLELFLKKNNSLAKDADGRTTRTYTLNYRMVEPYIEGMELRKFAEEHIHAHEDMALLILKAAEEANRIHHRGVIHGDISSRNILVSNLPSPMSVHFIDFGLAYFSDGLADVGYNKYKDKDEDEESASPSMAPERFKHEKIPAHPSQDVFSLAMTFDKLLEMQKDAWIAAFREHYPVIAKFIDKGKEKDNAKLRPSLHKFINELKEVLESSKALTRTRYRA